ncbi:MAG: (deoxy)nucleoside triphosphate pyrophosphohydrolase [Clostridia bacterium]|nr:(deoxy)nucleoside triphosphate pyrophosphohydrolase [Clostridia bacterium]
MIEVVAGIIYKNNKFLIAQRNLKKAQGGLWEFPGGKVEKNESYESALIREIKEELNADIEVNEYIGERIHHYPEKDIKLIFYKAKLLSEKVELLEHESCKWITKDEKDKFEFAGADKVVFDLI